MTDFDDLLERSSQPLPETPALRAEVARLVRAARASSMRRRATPSRLAIGTATAVMVSLGGAAAAAGGLWTAPWAHHPLTSITYTLPSGTTCAQRIGNLHIANVQAQDLIRDWLSAHPIDQIIDLHAAIAEIRSEPNTWVRGDGRSVQVGYGTPYYDPDYEYDTAVWRAISSAISRKLNDAGYTTYLDVTWSAETHCTGADPSPEVPAWLK